MACGVIRAATDAAKSRKALRQRAGRIRDDTQRRCPVESADVRRRMCTHDAEHTIRCAKPQAVEQKAAGGPDRYGPQNMKPLL
jgi:hypothetical protein